MSDKINILENHLQLLDELSPNCTDEFFYTRLKARMEQEMKKNQYLWNLRPLKLIGVLALLFIINLTILLQQVKNNAVNSMHDFAKNYSLTIDSPY